MPEKKREKGKHLTLEERQEIQRGLREHRLRLRSDPRDPGRLRDPARPGGKDDDRGAVDSSRPARREAGARIPGRSHRLRRRAPSRARLRGRRAGFLLTENAKSAAGKIRRRLFALRFRFTVYWIYLFLSPAPCLNTVRPPINYTQHFKNH